MSDLGRFYDIWERGSSLRTLPEFSIQAKTRLGGTCRRGRIIRQAITGKRTHVYRLEMGERPVCPRVFRHSECVATSKKSSVPVRLLVQVTRAEPLAGATVSESGVHDKLRSTSRLQRGRCNAGLCLEDPLRHLSDCGRMQLWADTYRTGSRPRTRASNARPVQSSATAESL